MINILAMVLILKPKTIVTVEVLYFIPKTVILQELIWQTEDIVPELPRVHRFLNFWHQNIDAHLSEIFVYSNKDMIKIR